MQKFYRGGAILGYFKKRRGAAASSVGASTGRQCLNISLVIFLGGGRGKIDTSPPLNTPLWL